MIALLKDCGTEKVDVGHFWELSNGNASFYIFSIKKNPDIVIFSDLSDCLLSKGIKV